MCKQEVTLGLVRSRTFALMLSAFFILTLAPSPALATFETNCVQKTGDAYAGGKKLSEPVSYVMVDMGNGYKKVSTKMLGALYQMYLAAKADGINLVLVSAFRNFSEQTHLRNCFDAAVFNGCAVTSSPDPDVETCPECTSGCTYAKVKKEDCVKAICTGYCETVSTGNCYTCHLASSAGYSKHQNGVAIDIHTNNGTNAAYVWMTKNNYANSEKFGFKHISTEPWHFNYIGTKPWADTCGGDGSIWQSICEAKAVSGATGIFKDYPDTLTGQEEAEALLAAGITKGCATNYFCPNCVTTRAMAITFLLRAANIDVGNLPATPSFSDLQAGAYYVPYVEKAKELGIINGYPDGTFKPDAPTKRSEFASMIVKTLGVPTVNPATASFSDVLKSYWAYKYIETLKALCITQGWGDGTFKPEDSMPRWQASIFIVRAFDLLNKNDCVSYCDDASCETASYCDPWQSCKFSSQCAESGTQERSCHDFACTGAVAQASCNESTSNQTQSCVQDTDGKVVEAWGSWSTCAQKEVCSTTGTKTRTRTVCKAGKQSTETQKKDCAFNLDPNKCNDGKACTVDVCKVGTGCVNTPQNSNCDDGNVCTKNVCKADKGCVTTNQDGASCDDGNACTESDMCAATKCSGKALSCNDNNACTADSCDAKTGCLNTAVSCDDQNACTVDSCDSKTGCANTPQNCDDGDLCTLNLCIADTGECANTAIKNCCVADEDCTAEGDCVTPVCDLNENQCTTEAVADCCVEDGECNDDNACTADSCADNNECENTEILGCCLADLDCNDDNACTADSCADNNECENAEISGCCLADTDCSDDNACTVDSCTENLCVSNVIDGCCTGKDDCSDSENCVNGACMEAVATDSGTEDGTTDGGTTDGGTTDGGTSADTGDDEGADDEGATDLSDDGGGDTGVDAGSGGGSGDTGSDNNNPGSESSGCVAATAPSSTGQPMAFLMLLFSLWILRRRNTSEPA